MKESSFVRIITSVVILAVGVGGFLWMGTPEVATRPPDRAAVPVVKTAIAEEHKDGIQFEVDGVVVPYRQIDIAAQVNGRVEFKSDQCRIGRAVKKGELLLRIEQSDYVLEVTRLEEELNQADAMMRELEVEVSTAGNQIELAGQQMEIDVRELERQKELVAKRAASETEVDGARRAELGTRNTLQTLKDQKSLLSRRMVRLESAKALVQANLDMAELSLARTEIRLLLDGVIVTDNVEQDGYLQMGSPVISLQDSSQLDVTCKLHMRQMHWLWIDQANQEQATALTRAYDFPETPATVIYQIGGAKYQWKGVVNRYDAAGIDNQTRMIPCRVYVGDPLTVTVSEDSASENFNPPTLMTGMFVKVRIEWNGMEWNGMESSNGIIEWNGMEWNGMEWNGMEWNGMEWNGMEWNGMEWNGRYRWFGFHKKRIQPGNAVWTVDGKGELLRKDALIANSDSEYVVAYQQSGGLQAGDAVVISPLASPLDGLKVHDLAKGPPPRPAGGGWGGRGGGPGGGGPGGGGPGGGMRGPPGGGGGPGAPAAGSARGGGPGRGAGTQPATGGSSIGKRPGGNGPRAEET